MSPVSPLSIAPGTRQYVSQIDGVRPSASTAPSIWYADVATPQRNPAGRLSTSSELLLMLKTYDVQQHAALTPFEEFSRPGFGREASRRPIDLDCCATTGRRGSGSPSSSGRTRAGSVDGTSSRSACRAGRAGNRGCRPAPDADRAAPGRTSATLRCKDAKSPCTDRPTRLP